MSTALRYIILGAVILAIIGWILYALPGDPGQTEIALNKLKIATGFTLLALVFLFGFAVLVCIANGRIDLSGLLSEIGETKGASMSRFQLLIFTLVIALSLFLVVVSKMAFPERIPPEILTLLGISASTYAVSKGIQASGGTSTTTVTPDATVTTSTSGTQPAPVTVTGTAPANAPGRTETATTVIPTTGGGGGGV